MCRDYRIRHDEFHAWPEDEQDKAIALAIHLRKGDADRCSACGTRPADWLDDNGRTLLRPAYMVETIRCEGCHRIDAGWSDVPDDERSMWHVRLRPSTDADFDLHPA